MYFLAISFTLLPAEKVGQKQEATPELVSLTGIISDKMWIFSWKGPSGFSACSTAEEVTQGIDGAGLTAIVTGIFL